MILHTQDNEVMVIRQTDHALLSGFFARELGNNDFLKPEPFESLRLAAAEHDNGWREWEIHPEVDPATFLPYSFMSIPTEQHIALYQRGLERILKVDRYAALLVSMHCVGLYDKTRATMPGFSSKYVRGSEAPLVNDFIQRLRLQQLRLKVDLRAQESTKAYTEEKFLQANLQRLEALDRLSLYFCLPQMGDAAIESVPINYDGAEVDWELRRESPEILALSPYPFRREPLAVSILTRRVPKRHYSDGTDFQNTLAHAPYVPMKFTLKRGKPSMQSLLAQA
jgi:Protein of unknown function (DUF3891)